MDNKIIFDNGHCRLEFEIGKDYYFDRLPIDFALPANTFVNAWYRDANRPFEPILNLESWIVQWNRVRKFNIISCGEEREFIRLLSEGYKEFKKLTSII